MRRERWASPCGSAACFLALIIIGFSWMACGSSGIATPSCNNNQCLCEKAGEELCCPGGLSDCAKSELQCRPRTECTAGAECMTAADCPQPGDAHCGKATCSGGVCGLSAKPLGKRTSQIRGDCRQVYCDGAGSSMTIEDGGDVYDDGLQCTLDICKDGVPVNIEYEEGTTCPDTGDCLCTEGQAVPCIEWKKGKTFCTGTDICDGIYCAPASCSQPVFDCGGAECPPCGTGQVCTAASDCYSHVCSAKGRCLAATCSDGVWNGTEPSKDCGAACGVLCPDGEGCLKPADCHSGVCWKGKCEAPACDDGVKNGSETDIDCGGPCEACL